MAGVTDLGSLDAEALSAEAVQQQQAVADHTDSTTGDPVDCIGNEAGYYMDVALAQALSALPPGPSVVSSPVCSTTSSDPADGGQTNADDSSTAFNHPSEAVITAPAVLAGRPAPDEQLNQVVLSPFAGAASAELLEAPTSAVATDAAPAESRNPAYNPDANVVSTAESTEWPAVDSVPAAEAAAGLADVPAGANSSPSTVSPSSSSPNSNSNSLSTLQITPLARAGSSNLTGQVKSPSRLRRMSVPEPQLQLALEQQADPLNPGMLAPGPLGSEEPAVLQLQLQEHVAQHHQELWQQDVQLLDLEPTGMPADSMQDTAAAAPAVQPAAALGRNSSNMVFGHNAEYVTGNSDLSNNTGHVVTSSNPVTPHHRHQQLPQLQQLLRAGVTDSSTSSSYSVALAATLRLSWPLTWYWPDKMLHAAATGVRPINIHLSQPLSGTNSGGYNRPSSPRGTSSSTYSSRGSRLGSPVSPRRGVAAGSSSSSRPGSPNRPRSPARSASGDQQQQQYKPPELLSAIHTHLAAAPAVKAAFEAATAAVLQGDATTHSSSTPSLNLDAATPEGSPILAWHAALQQQFAAAFAVWDKDGDGCLDADELRNMLEDVLPAGTVTKQEVRYCQVLLDRSGSGMLTPGDLLAAAHTAVALGVGIVPKPRVDINDVLLQLVVMLQQQQQQQGAGQGFTAQVRSLFHEFDTSGTGKLGQTELGRLFRRLLPAISHQETRFTLSHMCELDPESSGQVSLKQLVAAVQPVHQALQQSTGNSSNARQQLLPAVEGPLVTQQQQQQSQYDLPKPPSPLRLSPRPDYHGGSSSSNAQDAGGVVCLGSSGDTYDGGSSSSSAGKAALGVVANNDKPVPPVLWPMQELAALLSSNPAILQFAFMQTAAAAAADAKSPKHASQPRSSRNSSVGGGSSTPAALQQQLPHQQQQRYSLIPIALLPQLLAAAVPGWGGADISYAALQIRCHMNVIANFTVDTPTAAAAANPSGQEAAAAADPPTDLMYAELAATIISAAGTEAAAAAGQLPPAVEQLVVDLTDDLMSNDSSRAKLAAAWMAAAAAVSSGANNSSSSSSVNHAASKLPVVAAVKLLCKQLIASHGLSDIRLLGWLTCLVRQQHLAMQLAAVQDHGGSSSSLAAADQVLSAEIDLDQFCELLLQIVQGFLPAEDAALVEALRHHQQQQQQQHGGVHHWDAVALGDEQPGSETSNRRVRIMFDGSTPTPSDCSPAWHPAEHHQQKWDEGLRSLQSLDRVLEDKAGYFQPSHVKIPAYRGSNGGGSTPGSRTGGTHLYTSFLLEDNIGLQTRGSERFSSNGGGVLLPAEVQQQREQLDRLRAAQQQAWKAEMLMQHMPWEGAYSPVAALAAARAHGGGYFGQAKVVDILRISSSGFRTSSNAGEGY